MVQDVKLGRLENALNALQDGTSMPLEYAEPSPTNADHGLRMEIVIHVIQVMLSRMDNVFKILINSYQLLMTSVQFGRIEYV